MFDPQITTLQDSFGYTLDSVWDLKGISGQITRYEIDLFFKANGFHEFGIVIVVVVHHRHHLAMLETLHQDAISIEWGQAFRTDHRIQPALSGPAKYSLEQAACHLRVIDGLEPIKMCLFGLVVNVEQFVIRSTDAAHHFPISDGKKKIGLRVFEKGMFFSVERQVGVDI